MPGFREVVDILVHSNAHAVAEPLQTAGLCSLVAIRANEPLLRTIVKKNILLGDLLGLRINDDPIELFDEPEQKKRRKDFPQIQFASRGNIEDAIAASSALSGNVGSQGSD